MAKLPPKPMNVVHEYFPAGADGHSPFNSVEPVAYKKTGLVPEKRKVTEENKDLFKQGYRRMEQDKFSKNYEARNKTT